MNSNEDPASKKRRLAKERQQRCRANKSLESRVKLMNSNEDPASKKRRMAKERQQRCRANKSQESRVEIRNLDAASHRKRITQMTPEQLARHHVAHAAAQQRHMDRLTPQQREARHNANAASQQQRIDRMTPHELAVYHIAHAASQKRHVDRLTQQRISQASRNKAINLVEALLDEHSCGSLNHNDKFRALQISGDILIEHDNNQMEVDGENPTIHHGQKLRQIIAVRLNKGPKTSREGVLDAIVEIATENNRNAGPSEDNEVPGVLSKIPPKTAAQRMREYRERQKLAKQRLLQRQSNQDLDAIVSTSSSQVNQRAGPSTINTISPELTTTGNSQAQQQIETSERTQEYRERRNDSINIEWDLLSNIRYVKKLKRYEKLLEKFKTEERIEIIKEYESHIPPLSFQVLAEKFHVDPEYIQKTVSEKEQILKSCKNYRDETKKYKTLKETKTATTSSNSCESKNNANIFKTTDASTSPDPLNLPAVKIEISPTQLIEYNGPQAIRREEDASMDKSVLTTSNDNNLQESDASNLEEFADEAMETSYLSTDNEAIDQSTMHKEDEMNSDTGKLLSIKRETEVFERNDGIDVSYEGVSIKTEPQMLEEEHIEWNAVKTHPQAIKAKTIEIKTEPHHMLESNQVEDNPGNGIAIKREIITCENYDRENRSDDEREFMLNQNSIDSCPPCSDINVPAESHINYKSILLLDCSKTVKKENDIRCDQQLSPTMLPRAKETYGHDFIPDYIDTPEEAIKVWEMLSVYAVKTENYRAMIVLSQLKEALKEE